MSPPLTQHQLKVSQAKNSPIVYHALALKQLLGMTVK